MNAEFHDHRASAQLSMVDRTQVLVEPTNRHDMRSIAKNDTTMRSAMAKRLVHHSVVRSHTQ